MHVIFPAKKVWLGLLRQYLTLTFFFLKKARSLSLCIGQMPFPKLLHTLLRSYNQLAGSFRSNKYDVMLINYIYN